MSWLLENTLVSTAAAGLVFAYCRAFKPRPALAHVLWLLVLVKLICPPVLRLSLPFELPATLAVTGALAPDTTVPDTAVDDTTITALLRSDAVRDATSEAITTMALPTPASQAWGMAEWILALWILGSFAVLASMLVGIRRMQRTLRAGSPPSSWLLSEVEVLARRLGIDAPRVVVSSRIGSAFVWGLGRPTLLWPITSGAPDLGKVRSVIAHELAHIRRRDHWTAWFEIAATIALWWHPVLWLCRASLRLQAELACDAWAIWAVPNARHSYAGALIDAIEQESQAVLTVPVLAARPGARRAFEKRLMMILNEDTPRRLSGWATLPVAALSLTVLAGFSFAQDQGRDAREYRSAEHRTGQHKTQGDADAIRARILRKINAEFRKSLGKDFQIKRLSDIDEVVQRFVEKKASKAASASHGHDAAHGRAHQDSTQKKVEIRVHHDAKGGHAIEKKHADGAHGKIRIRAKGHGDREIEVHEDNDDARDIEIVQDGGKKRLKLRVHRNPDGEVQVDSPDKEVEIRVLRDKDGTLRVLRGGKNQDKKPTTGTIVELHDIDGELRGLGGDAGDRDIEMRVIRGDDGKVRVLRRGGAEKADNVKFRVRRADKHRADHDAHEEVDVHVHGDGSPHRVIRIEKSKDGDKNEKAKNIEVRVLRGGDGAIHVVRDGKSKHVDVEAILEKALGGKHEGKKVILLNRDGTPVDTVEKRVRVRNGSDRDDLERQLETLKEIEHEIRKVLEDQDRKPTRKKRVSRVQVGKVS